MEGDSRFVQNLVAKVQVTVRRQWNLPMDDIEDIAQEAIVRAVENIDRFKGESSLETWVKAIASNVAKEHWRSAKHREINVDPDKEWEISEEVAFDAQLVVDDFLAGLSDEERRIVEMTIADYSSEQMGKELGKTAEAVRTKKSRLLKRLRQLWRELED